MYILIPAGQISTTPISIYFTPAPVQHFTATSPIKDHRSTERPRRSACSKGHRTGTCRGSDPAVFPKVSVCVFFPRNVDPSYCQKNVPGISSKYFEVRYSSVLNLKDYCYMMGYPVILSLHQKPVGCPIFLPYG